MIVRSGALEGILGKGKEGEEKGRERKGKEEKRSSKLEER